MTGYSACPPVEATHLTALDFEQKEAMAESHHRHPDAIHGDQFGVQPVAERDAIQQLVGLGLFHYAIFCLMLSLANTIPWCGGSSFATVTGCLVHA